MSGHTHPTPPPLRSRQIVDELVRDGVVSAGDRDRAALVLARHVDVPTAPAGRLPAGRIAAEIAGYLGGILVIAAAAVFIGSQWTRMSPGTRVTALLVSALVLAAAAVAVRLTARSDGAVPDLAHQARLLLSGALAVGAAGVAGGAAGVWASLVLEVRSPYDVSIGFGTACALMVLGYVFVPTGLGQLGAAFTAAVTTMTLAFGSRESDTDPLVAAAALLGLAAVWIALTETGLWRETQLGRAVGGVLAIIGAQVSLGWEQPWVSYLLLLLVGVLGFVAYIRAQSWPYLGIGVVALTMGATEAAVDYSDGALGAAGALLVAGTVLLVASAVGLRLRGHRAAQPMVTH